MRRLVRSLAAAVLSFAAYAAGATPWVPPDNRLEFDIIRNGSPIGREVLTFERSGDRLTVDGAIEIVVRIAMIPVYRYQRNSTAVWREDGIESLRVTINDNGERSNIAVRRSEDGLVVDADQQSRVVPPGLKITQFWNIDVLAENALIDTTKGTVTPIEVSPRERAFLEIDGREIPAWRYRIRSDRNREIWYDDKGGLLKITQTAHDGSEVVTLRRF